MCFLGGEVGRAVIMATSVPLLCGAACAASISLKYGLRELLQIQNERRALLPDVKVSVVIDLESLRIEGDAICAICKDDDEDRKPLDCITACKHPFHQECLRAWVKSKSNCPNCRRALTPF